MKLLLLPLFLFIVLTGCKSGNMGFGKRSYHEQYGKKLSDVGLHDAALGRMWFRAAQDALNKPAGVTLPVRQVGYFSAEKPTAIGLSFQAKRGQKLLFQVNKNPGRGFVIYNEIWRVDGSEKKLAFAADTTATNFSYEVDEAGTYLFRMQPELLQSGEYTLVISIGPSLEFPVAGTAKIGSFWGAPRDGGARSHEGIDIFAPKRTPVLATSNGTISRVTENNIGGKVVFLRPEGKSMSVYYAHLDEQLVKSGQRVKAGDTIGLVGNTGNAKSTPPHLHFGIYTSHGAIDPLAFVDPVIRKPGPLSVSANELNRYYRIVKDIRTSTGVDLKKNSIVRPIARNNQFYWVDTGGDERAGLPANSIQPTTGALSSIAISDTVYVFERADPGSPRKGYLRPGTKVGVLGTEREYAFVKTEDLEGWIIRKAR